uniref:Uncharacterized protein n=1 Tax=Hyaloperonospora arabidopsidis (strain Emoy2) TaxID=559515 RepID=M4BCE9_HYAAE
MDEGTITAPSVSATAALSFTTDMDEESKKLMDGERSCIFEVRIEQADFCRQRGSTQFQAGNTDEAVKWYERALYHVDFDEGTWHFEFTNKNRADVNVVRLPVYLNLAACYLLQGAPKDGELDLKSLAKVVENADLALAIDPENDKALYRGGRALLLTGDLDGAKEKLTRAAKHHPTDGNIRKAMMMLKERVAEDKKEEKVRWGGRLLGKDKEVESKTAYKQRPLQLKKTSESSHALWMFAVVLIGIALALGQLSLVE